MPRPLVIAVVVVLSLAVARSQDVYVAGRVSYVLPRHGMTAGAAHPPAWTAVDDAVHAVEAVFGLAARPDAKVGLDSLESRPRRNVWVSIRGPADADLVGVAGEVPAGAFHSAAPPRSMGDAEQSVAEAFSRGFRGRSSVLFASSGRSEQFSGIQVEASDMRATVREGGNVAPVTISYTFNDIAEWLSERVALRFDEPHRSLVVQGTQFDLAAVDVRGMLREVGMLYVLAREPRFAQPQSENAPDLWIIRITMPTSEILRVVMTAAVDALVRNSRAVIQGRVFTQLVRYTLTSSPAPAAADAATVFHAFAMESSVEPSVATNATDAALVSVAAEVLEFWQFGFWMMTLFIIAASYAAYSIGWMDYTKDTLLFRTAPRQ